MWDLVPWPGTEPGPPALETWSLSHWEATPTREVPANEVQAEALTYKVSFVLPCLILYLSFCFLVLKVSLFSLSPTMWGLGLTQPGSAMGREKLFSLVCTVFSVTNSLILLGMCWERSICLFPYSFFFFFLFLLQKPYSWITRIHFYDNH